MQKFSSVVAMSIDIKLMELGKFLNSLYEIKTEVLV